MPGNYSFLFFFLCHIKWEKSWFGKLQVWSPYACYSEVYNGALRSCLSFWQLWLFFFYETQLLLASVLTKGFPVWLLLTGALIGPDFFHLMMDCAPGNFESFNIFLARLSASTSQHSSFLRSNEGFMNFLLCTEPEGHDEDRCENPKCLYSPWSRDRVPPGVVKSIDVPRPVVPNIFLD